MRLFIFIFILTIVRLEAQDYTVQHVTLIPMNKKGSLTDMTVIMQEGKIRKIGPSASTSIPPNTTVIDGRNKFLIPGLYDMHAHFFYEQGENVNTCDKELKMMLANGLTSVRIECGDSLYLDVREKVNS